MEPRHRLPADVNRRSLHCVWLLQSAHAIPEVSPGFAEQKPRKQIRLGLQRYNRTSRSLQPTKPWYTKYASTLESNASIVTHAQAKALQQHGHKHTPKTKRKQSNAQMQHSHNNSTTYTEPSNAHKGKPKETHTKNSYRSMYTKTRDYGPRSFLTNAAALPGHAKTNLYTGRSPPSPIFSCSSRGQTWKKSSTFCFSHNLRMALNGLST